MFFPSLSAKALRIQILFPYTVHVYLQVTDLSLNASGSVIDSYGKNSVVLKVYLNYSDFSPLFIISIPY